MRPLGNISRGAVRFRRERVITRCQAGAVRTPAAKITDTNYERVITMSLLNILKARRDEAARHRNRRRVLLGLEDLEVRKVLSTVAPSKGTFEGMP